ncbi:MAG: hypothetical protein E7624_03175 [Ruminococcaceae bacterium]|nr:hypothetical protein [Oscillospiraceae bacterium]
MRKKRDFFARLGKHLDIPAEALPGGFSLSLYGQSSLILHGKVRICEYTETRVVLLVGKRRLHVEGEDLLCSEFETDKLQIIGTVFSLSFEKEAGNAG